MVETVAMAVKEARVAMVAMVAMVHVEKRVLVGVTQLGMDKMEGLVGVEDLAVPGETVVMVEKVATLEIHQMVLMLGTLD